MRVKAEIVDPSKEALAEVVIHAQREGRSAEDDNYSVVDFPVDINGSILATIRGVLPIESQFYTAETRDNSNNYKIVYVTNYSSERATKSLDISQIKLESNENGVFQVVNRDSVATDKVYGNYAQCAGIATAAPSKKMVSSLKRGEECILVYHVENTHPRADKFISSLNFFTNQQHINTWWDGASPNNAFKLILSAEYKEPHPLPDQNLTGDKMKVLSGSVTIPQGTTEVLAGANGANLSSGNVTTDGSFNQVKITDAIRPKAYPLLAGSTTSELQVAADSNIKVGDKLLAGYKDGSVQSVTVSKVEEASKNIENDLKIESYWLPFVTYPVTYFDYKNNTYTICQGDAQYATSSDLKTWNIQTDRSCPSKSAQFHVDDHKVQDVGDWHDTSIVVSAKPFSVKTTFYESASTFEPRDFTSRINLCAYSYIKVFFNNNILKIVNVLPSKNGAYFNSLSTECMFASAIFEPMLTWFSGKFTQNMMFTNTIINKKIYTYYTYADAINSRKFVFNNIIVITLPNVNKVVSLASLLKSLPENNQIYAGNDIFSAAMGSKDTVYDPIYTYQYNVNNPALSWFNASFVYSNGQIANSMSYAVGLSPLDTLINSSVSFTQPTTSSLSEFKIEYSYY